jgi:hypothetical protein
MRHRCGRRFLRGETHYNAAEPNPARLRNWHVRGRISRLIGSLILGCHKVARDGVFGFTSENVGATIYLF